MEAPKEELMKSLRSGGDGWVRMQAVAMGLTTERPAVVLD